ncbi:hypothetical protein ACX93W_26650 [Paenibacillus sp. CAU 1782]
MSPELYAVMALSLIVITALLTVIILTRNERERVVSILIMKHGEREIEWNKERQQLLDRIQAPSFGEMKQAEVKIIKAQQGHKEPPQLEPL